MRLIRLYPHLLKVLSENDFARENYMKFSMLTAREKEALRYIVKGHSNQEIAEQCLGSEYHSNAPKQNLEEIRD